MKQAKKAKKKRGSVPQVITTIRGGNRKKGKAHMSSSKKGKRGRRKAAAPVRIDQLIMGKRRKHRGRRMSGMSGLMPKNMKGTAQDILFGSAGAIGAAYGMRYIPLQDTRIKAAIPILLGMFLAGNRNTMISRAGLGIGIAGALAAVKAFMPNVPMLQGAVLGGDPLGSGDAVGAIDFDGEDAGELLGAVADFQGDEYSPELMGAVANFQGDEGDFQGEDDD